MITAHTWSSFLFLLVNPNSFWVLTEKDIKIFPRESRDWINNLKKLHVGGGEGKDNGESARGIGTGTGREPREDVPQAVRYRTLENSVNWGRRERSLRKCLRGEVCE